MCDRLVLGFDWDRCCEVHSYFRTWSTSGQTSGTTIARLTPPLSQKHQLGTGPPRDTGNFRRRLKFHPPNKFEWSVRNYLDHYLSWGKHIYSFTGL